MSTIICNNRFAIPIIDIDECIGLSLVTINNNFNDLKQENCLTHEQLNTIQNSLNTVYTNYAILSTMEDRGRFAKAWVSFNGATTTPTICSSYNVLRVDKYGTGTYGLSFANVFSPISGYCLVGTTSAGMVQPTLTTPFTSVSADINIRTPSGTLTNSQYISIAVYSL